MEITGHFRENYYERVEKAENLLQCVKERVEVSTWRSIAFERNKRMDPSLDLTVSVCGHS